MRYCRHHHRRFFVSPATLAALSTSAFFGFTAPSSAVAAPPVAAFKPAASPEWTGELPTPPQQTAPWTLPPDSGLPANLLEAARLSFNQGLADPRGCDYQTVTVRVGSVWNGDGGVVETHGWVLPQETRGQKFAVCWNGLVYPVAAAKGRADLDADVNLLIARLAEVRERKGIDTEYISTWQSASPEARSVFADSPYNVSLLRAVLLLRFGKNDLAQKIADAWKSVTPPRMNDNDEILRDPYLYLASQWAWTAYERAVCAHMRGADALALADTSLLMRAQPLIEVEAAKRAYKNYPSDGGEHRPGAPYLTFLHNLPDLQKDAARRVAEASRPPIAWATLKTKPQAERIAFLISRLDDVAARQSGQPGGVGLNDDPISQALIAEGDAAVDALLDTMERDVRLTRSVSFPRDFFQVRNLLSVKDAAFVCFVRITEISEIRGQDGKPRDVAALRAWWVKNRKASPAQRWFAQLADEGEAVPAPANAPRDGQAEEQARQRQFDVAFSNKRRWEEAARNIVERTNIHRAGMSVAIYLLKPGEPLPPFKGEPLRAQTDPSVSDLLRKRALQLSEPMCEKWGFDYAAGASFALRLYEWDTRGAQTLSTLQEVMRRCLEYQNRQERGQGHSEQYQLPGRIARLTLARVYLGDDAAASEYEAWLRTVSPEYLGFNSKDSLLALWREPGNPALKAVADWLFAETPASGERPAIWSRLLASPTDRNNYYVDDLLRSDLIRVPAFQYLVVKRLTDRTPAGFVTQKGDSEISRQFDWNISAPQRTKTVNDDSLRKQSLRTCDRVAIALRDIAGCPSFDPFASVEKRDAQCAAIASFIQRWGVSLDRAGPTVSIPPLYSNDSGDIFAYLGPTFRIAERPATEADVQQNRAIFHLRGQKTRVTPTLPAALPSEARWNKDPNPIKALRSDGKVDNYSSGLIWQAEDEWNGKAWTRYYGYVGPHGLYKVPAGEIEFRDRRVFAAQKAQATNPK